MVYFSTQTHVLGCRSLFQCVFCLTAGVSTSSTWIEEGQPGGVCGYSGPQPGAPQRWAGGGGDGEGGDRAENLLLRLPNDQKSLQWLKVFIFTTQNFPQSAFMCHQVASHARSWCMRKKQSQDQVHEDVNLPLWHHLQSFIQQWYRKNSETVKWRSSTRPFSFTWQKKKKNVNTRARMLNSCSKSFSWLPEWLGCKNTLRCRANLDAAAAKRQIQAKLTFALCWLISANRTQKQ